MRTSVGSNQNGAILSVVWLFYLRNSTDVEFVSGSTSVKSAQVNFHKLRILKDPFHKIIAK